MKSSLRSLRVFACAATLSAFSAGIALAGQGAASYFDINGATAGFGSPSGAFTTKTAALSMQQRPL